MSSVREFDIKNGTYYFLNEMISIKKLDPKKNHTKISLFTTKSKSRLI